MASEEDELALTLPPTDPVWGDRAPQRIASWSGGPPPTPADASPPPPDPDASAPPWVLFPPGPNDPPGDELVDLHADFLTAAEEQPAAEQQGSPANDLGCSLPPWAIGQAGRRRRLVPKDQAKATTLTPQQRLLLLDTWQRSGLPAGDFAALVGISKHTLYSWKKKFDNHGPAGLLDQPKGGPRGSQLSDLTKRTILLLKQSHPDWGCQRISDMLLRGPALPASPQAVARVLHEAGYTLEEAPTRPHPDKVRRFERACPNQLWQTDLFTFVLKWQNRRVYLVAFMDDHSRFIVGYGLHASQSTALVLEVLRAAITSYGRPEEILTDNGSQYVTWRGTSAFTRELQRHGIKQIVASPRRPQTLGKIERFWGTLWRECVETAIFLDLGDARQHAASSQQPTEPQKKCAGNGGGRRHSRPGATTQGRRARSPSPRRLPQQGQRGRADAASGRGDATPQVANRTASTPARAGLQGLGTAAWLPLLEAADFLHLSTRTLRYWRQHFAAAMLPLHALGRPVLRSSQQQRNDVIELLRLLGPRTSLATLWDCFADMPGAELDNLLGRYRHVWRRRYQQAANVLHWTTPGVIWAIDFTEAPQPIDGVYPYLLAVRDLASGKALLWQPLVEATAAATCAALAYLFTVQGAPLVLKMGNGCGFNAGAKLALLLQAEVIALFSPPYVPRYNGSIKASIGALKARTEAEAVRHGRPG
jgi:transposase InsO family protein